MNKTHSNPCPRCGTERITVKTWKEKIYDSVILNKQTACPNLECQKIVDKDNKRQQDKNNAMKLRSQQRIQNRRAGHNAKKSAKHA